MGSNTGLTSRRRKCKAVRLKRKVAMPPIVRRARTIVTLDIGTLELFWLSTTAVAWFVSVCFVNILKTSFILSVCDIPAGPVACGKDLSMLCLPPALASRAPGWTSSVLALCREFRHHCLGDDLC